MEMNLKGKYLTRIINNSKIGVYLFDRSDQVIFSKFSSKIGAVDFIDSVDPHDPGELIDITHYKIILNEMDIASVSVISTDCSSGYCVWLQLNPDNAEKFTDYTKNNIGHFLMIVEDGRVISSPSINAEIIDGSAMIEGDFTEDTANYLASIINSHRLPFGLKTISTKDRLHINW
jgi:preprotein translocase subunit SecD